MAIRDNLKESERIRKNPEVDGDTLRTRNGREREGGAAGVAAGIQAKTSRKINGIDKQKEKTKKENNNKKVKGISKINTWKIIEEADRKKEKEREREREKERKKRRQMERRKGRKKREGSERDRYAFQPLIAARNKNEMMITNQPKENPRIE